MPDPESGGREGDCGDEVSGELVIAGCDGSEVFETVEEAFDEIALSVDLMVDGSADPDVALTGDVGLGAASLDQVDDGLGVVSPIGDHVSGQRQVGQQLRCRGLVGGLAGGDDEADRQAATVDDHMDLGGQSAARSSDGVIRAPFFPPAACWWARTIEESIR